MTIDLREFDQREHGMRDLALRMDLLEPTVDRDMVERIRDEMDAQAAARCMQRYKRDVAKREREG